MSLTGFRKQVLELALVEAKTSYAQEMSTKKKEDPPNLLREQHQRARSISIKRVNDQIPLTSTEENVLSILFDNVFLKLQQIQITDSKTQAIGIDLGTTYSCVSFYNLKKKQPLIIPNELGMNLTPSYVAFDDVGNVLIGDPAKNDATINPEERIYDVKRLIGRTFDDHVVQQDITLWPFKVVGVDNIPKIQVSNRTYFPEQISAKILANLKRQAEQYLGHEVTNAVITVPAYFNDGQRQATKDAGTIAGLNVLRILNEPTAAAIAYNHQEKLERQKNILVFDLGGGTFDLVIVSIDRHYIRVKAVGGDTHLGGEDFDNAMVNHCTKEFLAKNGIDLSQSKVSDNPVERAKALRCLKRLKIGCEAQKKNLVAARAVNVALEAFYGEIDLKVKFTRDLFNRLNQANFEKCIQIVEEVLEDSGLTKDDVDDIVMVGGSSKILRIRELVQNFFDGRDLCMSINPDEAVAKGAAIQAALMMNAENEQNQKIKSSDVIPLPIGIKVRPEPGQTTDFSVIINKNTKIPCSGKQSYETAVANQKSITIAVYEGVHSEVKNNYLLGSFTLEDLPPDCPEGEQVDVYLTVNEEGILHVTAECPRNQVQSQILVTEFKKRLQPADVNELVMEEVFIAVANTMYT